MTIEPVLDRHIAIMPGVAGGKPHIAGHRITVQNIVIWHERMGLGSDEIATEYNLTLADIYAALAYYYDHHAEIDAAIEDDEAFVAALRQMSSPTSSHHASLSTAAPVLLCSWVMRKRCNSPT
jgi:uncharacterized protein (DUF433 family)